LLARALRYQHEAMGNDHFGALSEDKRQVARAALANVVGSAAIASATPLRGGATAASVFRIEAGGRRYLLRIEGPASPLRNPHQYVALRTAAEAGIAPRVYYADEAARVAVMDFVEQQPLQNYPGGPRALARATGELLRRLQETPALPYFVEYPDIVARLWAHICRTGLFGPGVLDRYTEHLALVRERYVWDSAKSVSAHNDAIPSNILFDGNRLWLVDWESAYRNDPLVDVAIVLDNLARSPELEETLLASWLGRAADEALRERLTLTRALTRLYYAGVLLSASATFPRTAPDTDPSAPTLAEFQRTLGTGSLKPGAPETKHILGKMFLAAFLLGSATPGFDAAV
jgi:aminoglycoside phosphotransferase (APT) family kinase protein